MPEPTKKIELPTLGLRNHPRRWLDFVSCYPVISRRSKGLSIGINLNPDKACNFDCIYCQVDRTTPAVVRKVELPQLTAELDALLDAAANQSLFQGPPFDLLPPEQRLVRDIAFSGDGEPTTFPLFDQAVETAAEAKRRHGLDQAKLVLISDACFLTRPMVRRGLAVMDANNGEIWAKLDAGTEEYYRLVNRPSHPLRHIIDNIIDAACARPVVIQSLWMRVHGEPPPDAEVRAFCDRLNEILAAGGQLKLVQIYSIARRPTEAYATPLADTELDQVADGIRQHVTVPIESYYGVPVG